MGAVHHWLGAVLGLLAEPGALTTAENDRFHGRQRVGEAGTRRTVQEMVNAPDTRADAVKSGDPVRWEKASSVSFPLPSEPTCEGKVLPDRRPVSSHGVTVFAVCCGPVPWEGTGTLRAFLTRAARVTAVPRRFAIVHSRPSLQ